MGRGLLTRAAQSETFPSERGMGRRAMMRPSAILMSLFAGLIVAAAPGAARAQPATAVSSHHHGLTAEEFSAQSRRVLRRTPRRVPVYRGSQSPGPNSVRVCNAYYEQEYRPSGTVIVPRMRCAWSG